MKQLLYIYILILVTMIKGFIVSSQLKLIRYENRKSLGHIKNEFELLIEKLEILETKICKNKDILLINWYEKYNDIYWDCEENCLYTIYENDIFPVKEFSCENKLICFLGPFIFDLRIHSVRNIYKNILDRYIKIFKQRISIISI